MGLWSSLWQDFQAWRRGERRVAPHGVRGRVYSRTGKPGNIAARTKLEAKMSVRVYRAEEGVWYRQNPVTGEMMKEE